MEYAVALLALTVSVRATDETQQRVSGIFLSASLAYIFSTLNKGKT